MGLSDYEVEKSRKEYGSNKITTSKKNTFLKLLIESLGDPIIKILLIALAIKVVFLFRNFDWYETLGILIAIFLASFISSISEYGSEQAFNKLQEESEDINCKVYRNNILIEVHIDDIVVGDLVELSSGDKIPADGYIIKGFISVDESSLSGEAKECKKEAILSSNNITKKNMINRGCVIYSGTATMKVTKVGDNTIYGSISKELQEKVPISPLKIKLRKLAKTISKIGYIGAILASITFLFSVIVIENNYNIDAIKETITNIPLMINYLIYALTLSVTIVVVAVPEGLPMMITLVLSSNMKRMLKDNILVRKLVGIETAGSMNLLLTDKTGTLTTGILEVSKIYNYDKYFTNINDIKKYPTFYNKIYLSLFYNNESIYSNKKIIGGNSTDKALMNFIKKDDFINKKVDNKTPFNSENKYSFVKIDNKIYIKGAAERILPNCKKILSYDGKEKSIFDIKNIEEKINILTTKGSRIIVLAYGENITNLVYLGFVEIKDELRKEAKTAIDKIHKAGIQTIMITGDDLKTASSIAQDAGIINSNSILLTSNELNNMSDYEISKILHQISIIARALPSDKSRLVKIAQNKGLVVGMTGDGVNDAPALKKANIGFAMGSGTEVAKEAADIVILDNNIYSISKAVLYGRTIFKSIRRFIIYQLTVNMCALALSIIGSLIGITTPITIVQMLWLNMIMDTFAGLAFSFESPLNEYMEEKPKKKDTPIINKYMYSQIIYTGVYNAFLCILFLKLPIIKKLIRFSDNNEYLMTAYFAMFIFLGIFNAFNARTERINIFANLKKNIVFIIIFTFIFMVQLFIIYYGGETFRTYGLTPKELLLVLILSLSVIPIDFIRKIILKKHNIILKV